jgi:hypothetical protein
MPANLGAFYKGLGQSTAFLPQAQALCTLNVPHHDDTHYQIPHHIQDLARAPRS